MKTRKMSLARKMVWMMVITFLALAIVAVLALSIFVNDGALGQTNERLRAIAEIAAAEINSEDVVDIMSEDDAAYQKLMQQLTKYTDKGGVTGIYILRWKDEEYCEFVVDTAKENPAKVGELYTLTDNLRDAFAGNVVSNGTMTHDEKWEDAYSAFAPIYMEDGSVAGIVGCDEDASAIRAAENAFVCRLVLGMIVALIPVWLMILYINRKFVNSMNMLHDKMCAIIDNEDDMREKIEIDTGDEFEIIADTFNQLIEKIYTTLYKMSMLEIELNKKMAALEKGQQIYREHEAFEENVLGMAEKDSSDRGKIVERIWEQINELTFVSGMNNSYLTEQNQRIYDAEEKVRKETQIRIDTSRKIHDKFEELKFVIQKYQDAILPEDYKTLNAIKEAEEHDYDKFDSFVSSTRELIEQSQESRKVCEERFKDFDERLNTLRSITDNIMQSVGTQENILPSLFEEREKYSKNVRRLDQEMNECLETLELLNQEIESYIVQ